MAFAMRRDNEFEHWLQPFTGAVMLPGYRRQLRKTTRLWFELYWQLLALGFTEQQLADHALEWRWVSKLPDDLALDQAVMDLAREWGIEVRDEFDPFTEANHPRH